MGCKCFVVGCGRTKYKDPEAKFIKFPKNENTFICDLHLPKSLFGKSRIKSSEYIKIPELMEKQNLKIKASSISANSRVTKKRNFSRKCFVEHCKNTNVSIPSVRFYKFPPNNSDLYKTWVKQCNLSEADSLKTCKFVCENHFTSTKINKKKLKKNAYPNCNLDLEMDYKKTQAITIVKVEMDLPQNSEANFTNFGSNSSEDKKPKLFKDQGTMTEDFLSHCINCQESLKKMAKLIKNKPAEPQLDIEAEVKRIFPESEPYFFTQEDSLDCSFLDFPQDDLSSSSDDGVEDIPDEIFKIDENIINTSKLIKEDDLFTKISDEHNGTISYKCKSCAELKSDIGKIKKHVIKHEERSTICQKCGDNNIHKKKLFHHERKCDGTVRFSRFMIKSETGQARGKLVEFKLTKEQRVCPECKKSINTTLRYYDHLNLHSKEKPYQCGCGGKSNNYNNFWTHLRKFKCQPSIGRIIPSYAPQSLMTTDFSKPENILRKGPRSTTQNQPKPFPKLKLPSGIIKKFICPECGKECKTQVTLRAHCQATHMDRIHPCSECKRKFSTPVLLKRHINFRHFGKFKCDKCDKVLPSKDRYWYHQRTAHRKQNLKFKCAQCPADQPKEFALPSFLLKHIDEVHLGKIRRLKTFLCKICNEEVRVSIFLAHYKNLNHRRLENNWKEKLKLKNFSCILCHNVEFEKFCDYFTHRKKFHKMKYSEIDNFFDSFKINKNEDPNEEKLPIQENLNKIESGLLKNEVDMENFNLHDNVYQNKI